MHEEFIPHEKPDVKRDRRRQYIWIQNASTKIEGEVHQKRKFAHHVTICPNPNHKLGLRRSRRFSIRGNSRTKDGGARRKFQQEPVLWAWLDSFFLPFGSTDSNEAMIDHRSYTHNFSAHAMGELPCSYQPPAPSCVVWRWRLKRCFAPASAAMGRLHRAFSPIAAQRLCHADEAQQGRKGCPWLPLTGC